MVGKHRKQPDPEPIIGRPPKRFTEQPQSHPTGNQDPDKRGRGPKEK